MTDIARRRVGRPANGFVAEQLNVRVPPEVKAAAKRSAANRGLSENWYLAALIAQDSGDPELKNLVALLNQETIDTDERDAHASSDDPNQEVLLTA
ncbi:MAG: hypothetical protein WA988_16590 [Candidatus Nanopelagicales bacterium]